MQEHSWKDPAHLVHAAHALTTPRHANAHCNLAPTDDRASSLSPMNPIPPDWRLPCASPLQQSKVTPAPAKAAPLGKRRPFRYCFQAGAGWENSHITSDIITVSYLSPLGPYGPYPTEILLGMDYGVRSSGDGRQKAGSKSTGVLFKVRIFSLAAGFLPRCSPDPTSGQ
jgi:hypothetical protein